MKNIILILALCGIFTGISAQTKEKKTPESKAAKYSDEMKTDLGLTAAQRDKVYAIRLARIKAEEKIKAKYPDKKNDERKVQLKALKQEFKTSLTKILTPAQYTKYEQLKAAEKAKEKQEKQNKQKAKDEDD